jgi:hypothetical protein
MRGAVDWPRAMRRVPEPGRKTLTPGTRARTAVLSDFRKRQSELHDNPRIIYNSTSGVREQVGAG